MFYVTEVFLITVKIVLSPWIGKWLNPVLAWKAKKIKISSRCCSVWLCKMALTMANIGPKTTLELTGQLFSQKMPQIEGTLFSDLRKLYPHLPWMHRAESSTWPALVPAQLLLWAPLMHSSCSFTLQLLCCSTYPAASDIAPASSH